MTRLTLIDTWWADGQERFDHQITRVCTNHVVITRHMRTRTHTHTRTQTHTHRHPWARCHRTATTTDLSPEPNGLNWTDPSAITQVQRQARAQLLPCCVLRANNTHVNNGRIFPHKHTHNQCAAVRNSPALALTTRITMIKLVLQIIRTPQLPLPSSS